MSNDQYDSTKDGYDSSKKAAKESFEKAKEAASSAAHDFREEYDKFTSSKENKRVLAGLLGIILGWAGVHKFVLGYTQEGVIQLIAGILTGGIAGIIGIIEGVIYLTKTDAEFYETYQINKKPWF